MKKWLPVINRRLCTGCNKCVEACGPACLEVRTGIAELTDAVRCGSEEHCIPACPEAAISMVWLEHEGDRARGKWLAN